MRSLLVAVVLLGFALPRLAADAAPSTPDPTLTVGLQTCVSNGVDSGVRQWYADRPVVGAEMTARVLAASRNLGPIIDTEVVAIQRISKRVTRYYVALYFTRSPLWIRIERYQNNDKGFFLPLKCSVDPDDILPGYVTEFLR